MAKQTKPQQKIIARVMHEFKHHDLDGSDGRPVKTPKQAIAIALSEAGASDRETPKTNPQRLARATSGTRGTGDGQTRADLYAEAKRRDIAGRSAMSKAELEHALRS